jgi:hypothetical protein
MLEGVDYHKFNHIAIPNATAVPDLVSLMFSGVWYAAIDFSSLFFSILIRKDSQKLLTITWS